MMSFIDKILDLAELKEWLIKHSDEKVVFTNGCFDILHRGHVHLLERASNLGDRLIVGINTDSSVKRLKGDSRPINEERSRAEVLAALGSVDVVVLFDADTPLELINVVKPDVLVKGGDYEKYTIVGAKEVEAYGAKVVVIPLVEGYSSTSIVESIKNQNHD